MTATGSDIMAALSGVSTRMAAGNLTVSVSYGPRSDNPGSILVDPANPGVLSVAAADPGALIVASLSPGNLLIPGQSPGRLSIQFGTPRPIRPSP
jgi:hypothetical protein